MKTSKANSSQKYNLKDFIEYSDNSIVSKVIINNKEGNLTLFAFDKDEKLSEHTVPFDSVVQVIEGSCKVIIAGVENFLAAGEFIIMPANIPHAVEAVGKFKMLLTMIKEKGEK